LLCSPSTGFSPASPNRLRRWGRAACSKSSLKQKLRQSSHGFKCVRRNHEEDWYRRIAESYEYSAARKCRGHCRRRRGTCIVLGRLRSARWRDGGLQTHRTHGRGEMELADLELCHRTSRWNRKGLRLRRTSIVAVDLEKGLATLVDDYGRRWLGGSRNSPLKVGPIAAEIAELIKTGRQDPR